MNKYKILFDYLKKKVGPDPARLIIYQVYDDDCKKMIVDVWERLAKIYEKWGIRNFGEICQSGFIYRCFVMKCNKSMLSFACHFSLKRSISCRKAKCLEYDNHRLQRFLTSKKHMKKYGMLLDKYGDKLFRSG